MSASRARWRLRQVAFLLAACDPRTMFQGLVRLARVLRGAGRKRLLYPHVRFGVRTFVDESSAFEEGVSIGPDCTVFASSLGRQSYCAFRCWVANARVGRFCSIGPNVIIGMGRHPSRDYAATHPAFFSSAWPASSRYAIQDFQEHAPVEIGSDVWIGANAFIGPGVKIGHGAVIATGAVVTSDVQPYEIVGGVPARRIRLRVAEAEVAFLLAIAWWDWSDERLRALGRHFRSVGELRQALGGRAPPADAAR